MAVSERVGVRVRVAECVAVFERVGVKLRVGVAVCVRVNVRDCVEVLVGVRPTSSSVDVL